MTTPQYCSSQLLETDDEDEAESYSRSDEDEAESYSKSDGSAYPLLEVDIVDDHSEALVNTRVIVTLITVCLINMGDAVEIFLPGVLTQKISCDMKLTVQEHQMLSVVSYAFYVVGTFCSRGCANRIGRKKTMIISLCCSMVVSFTAALSHNLPMLIVSRAFTGLLVGSNSALLKVFWVETAPSVKIKNIGLFLNSISYQVGACYTYVLAYYILDLYSWRTFFLICSLPIFIVPLLILVFYLKETVIFERSKRKEEGEDKMSFLTKCLVLQLSIVYFLNILHYWGHILFIPKIYQEENMEESRNEDDCSGVYGEQYLKMGLILALGPFMSKFIVYAIFLLVGYPTLNMFLASFLATVCYIALIVMPGTELQNDILLGVVAYTLTHFNFTLWLYMMNAFKEGKQRANAAFVVDGLGKMGAISGTAIVAMLSTTSVGVSMSVLGVIQTVMVCVVCVTTRRYILTRTIR